MPHRPAPAPLVAALGVLLLAPPAPSAEGPGAGRAGGEASRATIRRHLENLRSRSPSIRRRSALALAEVGDAALADLEALVREDATRPEVADRAGDVIDRIRWGADLLPTAPVEDVPFDPRSLDGLGLGPGATSNRRLVEAIAGALRRHDETADLPTGVTLPLRLELNELDGMRAGRETPFDAVEARAEEMLTRYPGPRSQARILAMVAHVYGQSGCRPRTAGWAQRALRLLDDPVLRLRMYEYWYSATLLATRPAARRSTAEGRRTLLLPSLLALREAARYDLPAAAPELPVVGIPADRSDAARRDHRRQVEARVATRLLRDMVALRDIHRRRVLTHATRSLEEREQLRPLLSRPEVLRALARLVRTERDPADGLEAARRALSPR